MKSLEEIDSPRECDEENQIKTGLTEASSDGSLSREI